ncbi:CarD family transcriptional regulator [bacterium]|nr:CarD family transcriptional regulator [bacterium]
MTQEYTIRDQVVCKGQGVGEIVDIIERDNLDFYVLKLLNNKDVQVMVPTVNDSALRSLIPKSEVPKIFSILKDKNIESLEERENWNKRQRDYSHKLKNGSVYDLVAILKDLKQNKGNKKLSFGEKRIFDQAKDLLVQEISISEQVQEDQISIYLDECLASLF